MTASDARMTQYRILADHRLHFGRLYFQVIGTNLAILVASATAIAIGRPAWWNSMRLLVGLVLIGTAFVAHRLHRHENSYASALHAIEAENGLFRIQEPQGLHARSLVVIFLAAIGLMLAIEAAFRLT